MQCRMRCALVLMSTKSRGLVKSSSVDLEIFTDKAKFFYFFHIFEA